MNPFTYEGPEFLAFYLVLSIALLVAQWRVHTRLKTPSTIKLTTFARDPYQIAYLRGGIKGAVAVAILSLVDRQLLTNDKGTICVAPHADQNQVMRPLEKSLLAYFNTPIYWVKATINSFVMAACQQYQQELEDLNLIKNSATQQLRTPITRLVLIILISVTSIRLWQSFAHQHTNVGFLLLLTALFSTIVIFQHKKRLTPNGQAILKNLQTLFAQLKHRAPGLAAGGQTNEAALIAAIFGITALPTAAFPFSRDAKQAVSSSSCSTGSSCSSGSSSDSGGSSCGGGGCGGGGCGS